MEYNSKDTASAAIRVALTSSRAEEKELETVFSQVGIKTVAIDYGGEYITSVTKIIERAVVASKRQGIIKESHVEEGAVAGAAHEAISQLSAKAMGLNIGGKIAVARAGDHISVAVFFGIGLLHLNEVAVGLGHRVV